MGKAEENKRRKRSALLSHAFALFMNQGISNTTISDIARNAGVGKGTFYFYFKDKEELVERLITQKAGELINNALNELSRQKTDMSVEDKLVFIVDRILCQLCEDPRLLKFINKNMNYGLLAKTFSREDVKYELDIYAMYYELIIEDGSKWRDPKLMLYTMIELINGTCHTIILKNEPVDLETYKPYLFNCIRNIIKVFRLE